MNPHTTKVMEPKSIESTNSTTPAYMSDSVKLPLFCCPLFLHGEGTEAEHIA